ncbi:D-alanine--D-alanine ligase family protein [Corynebacterium sp. 335C]
MTSPDTRKTVAVVFGGASPEHSVSCISAGAIMAHLDRSRYDVVPVGITRDGTWVAGVDDPEALSADGRELPEVDGSAQELALSAAPARRGELHCIGGDRAGELFATVDVVFPVLHGPNGEDGTVQGLLELSGVPYVGPGVLASAAGMDKEATKALAKAAGIPIGDQVVLLAGEELTDADVERLGFPMFVKPARGGSSIGISKVDGPEGLDAALALAREHDAKVIVEAGIVGDEVECGVLQLPDGELTTSVPSRLLGIEDSEEGFYGFDTKYLDDVITAEIPAQLADGMTERVRELAKATFRALSCDGLARVDFFVTADGPVLNEINTMPGFTPISMYPQMFAKTDWSYPELLDALVRRAFAAVR